MSRGNKVGLSLSYELGNLQDAVDGARLILDHVVHQSAQHEQDTRIAPSAASAVLLLVSARMDSVLRVLRGEQDPRELMKSWNESPVGGEETEDVVLEGLQRRR